jgi:hypothetical protein
MTSPLATSSDFSSEKLAKKAVEGIIDLDPPALMIQGDHELWMNFPNWRLLR